MLWPGVEPAPCGGEPGAEHAVARGAQVVWPRLRTLHGGQRPLGPPSGQRLQVSQARGGSHHHLANQVMEAGTVIT